MKRLFLFFIFFGLCGVIFGFHPLKKRSHDLFIPTALAMKQNLRVEIKTIGELEAARSTIISSSIKGDQGKIIDLIPDGIFVNKGQILVRLDPSPFEEKVEKLRLQIKEQEGYMAVLEQAAEWEKKQAKHKNRTAACEIETAKLELDKIKYGDGPQEISRLKGAMLKARLKYEELNGYSQDLKNLESQGFINAIEVKQAEKKLAEEQEAYEMAQQQYDSYVQHVFPMQIKKGETALKRAQVNAKETMQAGHFQIAKAMALLDQAKESLYDTTLQLLEAEEELAQTEIKAPASGMVVQREEFRSGQRRRPRVGDILVKNQPLIDLPDFSSMEVKTRVREVDLYKVDVGKKATIEIDAYPHLTLQGTITSIGVLALSDYGREEKYFDIRISLDQCHPCLRPGMTARATIHAQKAENILTIPLHGVFEEDKHTFCYVLSNKGYEKKEIQLGISNDQWIEVLNGLQEGECLSLLNPHLAIQH